MAIKRYSGDRLTGLSNDEKPLTVMSGAVFFEIDTHKIFLLGETWQEISSVYEYVKKWGPDLEDQYFVYVGYERVSSTNWRIKRVDRADFSIMRASGLTGGQAAWDDRWNQIYE